MYMKTFIYLIPRISLLRPPRGLGGEIKMLEFERNKDREHLDITFAG